jgi:hypothetical protein
MNDWILLLRTGSPEYGRADLEDRIAETGERPPHDVPPSPRIRKIEPICDPRYTNTSDLGIGVPDSPIGRYNWAMGAPLRIGRPIKESAA